MKMKKFYFGLFALMIFGLSFSFVSAQTLNEQLRDVINRLSSVVSVWQQQAAVGAVNYQPVASPTPVAEESRQLILRSLQQQVNELQSSLFPYQPAPTTPTSQTAFPLPTLSTWGLVSTALPSTPRVPNGQGGTGCPGGATMPWGTNGQTIRCDGTRWVVAGNLLNDGAYLGVGINPRPGLEKLIVFTTQDQTALSGNNSSDSGIGVHGDGGRIGVLGRSSSGDGVVGQTNSGKAVRAIQHPPDGTGYGFYQSGANAKNYFEGKLGLGTAQNPAESLDLGGGNIKMGYEVVRVQANPSNGNGIVICSPDKRPIGGGCEASGGDTIASSFPYLRPGENGWACNFSGSASTHYIQAICANIR